jgi:hypothetical protein
LAIGTACGRARGRHARPAVNSAVLTFVVDREGAEKVRRSHKDKPDLDLVVQTAVLPMEACARLPAGDDASAWREKYPAPQLALLLRDDTAAVATALALRRPGNPLGVGTIAVLVHQSNEDRLLAKLSDAQVGDRDMSNLVGIGGIVRPESIGRVLKGDGR